MQKTNEIPHILRLLPGQDLKISVQQYVDHHKIKAGWIVTCVGSLTDYCIRFANKADGLRGVGYFEILTIAGTVSCNGSHLHIIIADETGRTIGGHLLDGCKIYTTAEIIIAESRNHVFTKAYDESTHCRELQVKKSSSAE